MSKRVFWLAGSVIAIVGATTVGLIQSPSPASGDVDTRSSVRAQATGSSASVSYTIDVTEKGRSGEQRNSITVSCKASSSVGLASCVQDSELRGQTLPGGDSLGSEGAQDDGTPAGGPFESEEGLPNGSADDSSASESGSGGTITLDLGAGDSTYGLEIEIRDGVVEVRPGESASPDSSPGSGPGDEFGNESLSGEDFGDQDPFEGVQPDDLLVDPGANPDAGIDPFEGSFPAEREVVARINAIRQAAGCPAAIESARLTVSARRHSAFMKENADVSEIGTDGKDGKARAAEVGYSGETVETVVAAGYLQPDVLVAALERNATTRQKLESCQLTDIGVGFDSRYWTVELARPTPA